MQVSNKRTIFESEKIMIDGLKPHELVSQSEMGNEIKRGTGKENARMSASVYQ